jgi:hypothetical protein
MVDAPALGAGAARCGGSSPLPGTNKNTQFQLGIFVGATLIVEDSKGTSRRVPRSAEGGRVLFQLRRLKSRGLRETGMVCPLLDCGQNTYFLV